VLFPNLVLVVEHPARRALAAAIVLVMGTAQAAPVLTATTDLSGVISCLKAYEQEQKQPPPLAPSTATVRTSSMTTAPTTMWQDDFTSLDLTTPGHQGAWRANDTWQPVSDNGYTDFGAGGSTYNVNPNGKIGSPFRIVKDPTATGGTALRISSRRMTSSEKQTAGVNCPWAGGFLVSNSDLHSFGYGYYEFRMKISHWGQGGFPALWLYAASGKTGNAQASNKGGAEVDLLEIFGYAAASPWNTTLHSATNNNGKSAIGDQGVATTRDDTMSWHTYAIDWTADHMIFLKDGKEVGRASDTYVAWLRGLRMDIRLNVAMDAGWFSGAQKSLGTTDGVDMDVDYVKVLSAKPSDVTPPVVTPPVSTPPVVKPPVTTPVPVDYNDQVVRLPLVGGAAPRPAASDHVCDSVAALLTLRGFVTPATGQWSALHTSNVKSFQAAKGLTVDGLVGANTWARLLYS
jgi:beta-glucanase (GH16 family)